MVVAFALMHAGRGLDAWRRPTAATTSWPTSTSAARRSSRWVGDVVPRRRWPGLGVAEAGIGFGFLAVVLSYLPVLLPGVFAPRVAISLLDARAGSPPTREFLRRGSAEA